MASDRERMDKIRTKIDAKLIKMSSTKIDEVLRVRVVLVLLAVARSSRHCN